MEIQTELVFNLPLSYPHKMYYQMISNDVCYVDHQRQSSL